MSFLSERLFGPLQIKHTIYLMLAILLAWRGLTYGSEGLLVLATATAFIGLTSAVVGVRSMSFEAKILTTLLSLFDSLTLKKEGGGRRSVERKPKEKSKSCLRPEEHAVLGAVLTSLIVSAPATTLVLYLLFSSNLDAVVKAAFCVAVLVGMSIPLILEVV